MVVECAREDVPISNWKESGSELASQRLEVLELRRKLRDDVLESIFAHIPHLIPSNFCIYPSIPTSHIFVFGLIGLLGFYLPVPS